MVDDCEAKALIADARHGEAARAAAAAPRATVRLAIGGEIEGFESYEEALAAEDDSDLDDPVTRLARCSTPRAPPGGPRGSTGRLRAARPPWSPAPLRLRGRPGPPPVHRPAVPRRPAGLLAPGPPRLGSRNRDHGALGRRRGPPPDRGPPDHPHPHGPDHVRPAPEAARRGPEPLRRLLAAPRAPRRRPVPGPRQARAHRVAGAGRLRVLRGHRGHRDHGRLGHLAVQAGHGRQGASRRAR